MYNKKDTALVQFADSLQAHHGQYQIDYEYLFVDERGLEKALYKFSLYAHIYCEHNLGRCSHMNIHRCTSPHTLAYVHFRLITWGLC